MRVVRFVSSGFAACVLAAAVLIGSASAASAQTTTVPPIPVTPGGQTATTTTTAPATGGGLASTGLAADLLVPFGFTLIGVGAAMQAASRRRSRDAYGLL